MKVNIKKVHPSAIIPKKAHPGDAGFDLTAVSREETHFGRQYKYDTGLAFEIPSGYVGLLFPRSSVCKKQQSLANCVGVLDSNFRGSVKLMFKNDITQPDHVYEVGDRIGQLIIMPYPEVEFEEVEELSDTDRGAGGFGSSGK